MCTPPSKEAEAVLGAALRHAAVLGAALQDLHKKNCKVCQIAVHAHRAQLRDGAAPSGLRRHLGRHGRGRGAGLHARGHAHVQVLPSVASSDARVINAQFLSTILLLLFIYLVSPHVGAPTGSLCKAML